MSDSSSRLGLKQLGPQDDMLESLKAIESQSFFNAFVLEVPNGAGAPEPLHDRYILFYAGRDALASIKALHSAIGSFVHEATVQKKPVRRHSAQDIIVRGSKGTTLHIPPTHPLYISINEAL